MAFRPDIRILLMPKGAVVSPRERDMLNFSVETSVRHIWTSSKGPRTKPRVTALNRDVKTHIARKRKRREKYERNRDSEVV